MSRAVEFAVFSGLVLLALGLACGSSSDQSTIELSKDRIASYVPYSPSEVSARLSPEGAQIDWIDRSASCVPGSRTGVHHFVVYRREQTGGSWEELSRPLPSQDCPDGYEFVDQNAPSGQTVVYGVSVVAEAYLDGKQQEAGESQITESFPLTIP
jgi:hypothetical protein